MEHLPYFAAFDYADKSDAGPKWEKWVNRLKLLVVGMGLGEDDGDRKLALLLHNAGERVYDIYKAEKGETATDYPATKKVLDDYFSPRKNTKWKSALSETASKANEYVTELRRKAKSCNFHDVESEILSQVIQCCRSNRLRRRALLTLGRSLEISDQQAKKMEGHGYVNVNTIQKPGKLIGNTSGGPSHCKSRYRGSGRGTQRRERGQSLLPTRGNMRQCRNCGGKFPHENKCPAKDKTFHYCKKQGHYKVMCRKRLADSDSKPNSFPVKNVTQENPDSSDFSDEDYCYKIGVDMINVVDEKTPEVDVNLNNKQCNLLIDIGASVNISDELTYRSLGSPKLDNNNKPILVPYRGGPNLNVLGTCLLYVETNHRLGLHKFCVVNDNHGALKLTFDIPDQPHEEEEILDEQELDMHDNCVTENKYNISDTSEELNTSKKDRTLTTERTQDIDTPKAEQLTRTRSGREVRLPMRFKDFCL
ncbi:LOW QUALITY PROTEIN: hypothetical protein KUTeg_012810 [Tegillarca granosa]|uniref:Uncharacterized protein n=1 Tax=Tegillarca granosa TaxID=220873 RepID=A0ABQ9F0B7_TEGGR|nr:LOW QUALITY PROTEIN: hypothetical protein KUTeg_012810 [Tegillarca granosa]